MTDARRAVLFDVDGTLLDVVENQRRIWSEWARRHELDPDWVYSEAVGTRPPETFAAVSPGLELAHCLRVLGEIEDEDVRCGEWQAFPGAGALLRQLAGRDWALVTSNYERQVRARFDRAGLPVPAVIVDADAVTCGKPDPEGYRLAARRLSIAPKHCLVIEDGATGIQAGRAAGMTVWAVNTDPRAAGPAGPGGAAGPAGPAAPAGAAAAQRTFATLAGAANEILAWTGAMPPRPPRC